MQTTAPRHSVCSTSYAAARPTRRCAVGRNRIVPRVASGSIFDLMDQQFEAMDRQFDMMQQQMEREANTAFSRARELERRADAEMQRALRESASSPGGSGFRSELFPAPNIDIQRQEERGPGTYRYYERIQITSGYGGRVSAYASAPPPAATSIATSGAPALPVLLGTMVLVGGYVALTTAFNRNYQLTTYAESKRWLLMALWPLLFLFSNKFREQFWAAVRGEKLGFKQDQGNGGGGSGGSKL